MFPNAALVYFCSTRIATLSYHTTSLLPKISQRVPCVTINKRLCCWTIVLHRYIQLDTITLACLASRYKTYRMGTILTTNRDIDSKVAGERVQEGRTELAVENFATAGRSSTYESGRKCQVFNHTCTRFAQLVFFHLLLATHFSLASKLGYNMSFI